jgi:uncharacterized ion transporter superfamily protein YfcC
MYTKLNSRIKKLRLRKGRIIGLLIYSKYAVLAFTALWLSFRFREASLQFLALAVILGMKWVFGSQKQIIQIFMQDEGR